MASSSSASGFGGTFNGQGFGGFGSGMGSGSGFGAGSGSGLNSSASQAPPSTPPRAAPVRPARVYYDSDGEPSSPVGTRYSPGGTAQAPKAPLPLPTTAPLPPLNRPQTPEGPATIAYHEGPRQVARDQRLDRVRARRARAREHREQAPNQVGPNQGQGFELGSRYIAPEPRAQTARASVIQRGSGMQTAGPAGYMAPSHQPRRTPRIYDPHHDQHHQHHRSTARTMTTQSHPVPRAPTSYSPPRPDPIPLQLPTGADDPFQTPPRRLSNARPLPPLILRAPPRLEEAPIPVPTEQEWFRPPPQVAQPRQPTAAQAWAPRTIPPSPTFRFARRPRLYQRQGSRTQPEMNGVVFQNFRRGNGVFME